MRAGTVTSVDGLRYYEKYKKEIAQAIKNLDKRATEEDFCVFVRENGYMVITPEGYEKLTKRDKKKIDKGYEHKQFAESKRTDE